MVMGIEICMANAESVYVSTITDKLPVLELALTFPVMVPLPEVGNPISGTAFTYCSFFSFSRLIAHSVMDQCPLQVIGKI
jgi:hypothetical protein